jgi:hypothetical protein
MKRNGKELFIWLMKTKRAMKLWGIKSEITPIAIITQSNIISLISGGLTFKVVEILAQVTLQHHISTIENLFSTRKNSNLYLIAQTDSNLLSQNQLKNQYRNQLRKSEACNWLISLRKAGKGLLKYLSCRDRIQKFKLAEEYWSKTRNLLELHSLPNLICYLMITFQSKMNLFSLSKRAS